MGERLPCKQEVTSSNLVVSTKAPFGASFFDEAHMHLDNCIKKRKTEDRRLKKK